MQRIYEKSSGKTAEGVAVIHAGIACADKADFGVTHQVQTVSPSLTTL